MPLVIGMDEAGYGPNLGPLVLTATVWEVPGPPQKTNFWSAFSKIARREVDADSDHLHVADSKEVYSPAIGLGGLERSVLAAIGLASRMPSGVHELFDGLRGCGSDDSATFANDGSARDLWFADDDLPLPLSEQGNSARAAAEKWQKICTTKKLRLREIRIDIVSPRRWNQATRETDNKATALSLLHLKLLRRVWDPDQPEPTLILADKHGGRNYYGTLLTECFDGRMFCCGGESLDSSQYRCGSTEIRFEARAERHFPVALASMVSKYAREVAMELFNRFWATHLPTLKPTHGYPVDSHRFRRDVAETQTRLAIPDDVFWRQR